MIFWSSGRPRLLVEPPAHHLRRRGPVGPVAREASVFRWRGGSCRPQRVSERCRVGDAGVMPTLLPRRLRNLYELSRLFIAKVEHTTSYSVRSRSCVGSTG